MVGGSQLPGQEVLRPSQGAVEPGSMINSGGEAPGLHFRKIHLLLWGGRRGHVTKNKQRFQLPVEGAGSVHDPEERLGEERSVWAGS